MLLKFKPNWKEQKPLELRGTRVGHACVHGGQPGWPPAVEGLPYSIFARRIRALERTVPGCRVREIGQSTAGPILCAERHGDREVVIVDTAGTIVKICRELDKKTEKEVTGLLDSLVKK